MERSLTRGGSENWSSGWSGEIVRARGVSAYRSQACPEQIVQRGLGRIC